MTLTTVDILCLKNQNSFVVVVVAGQLFGIPILHVREILQCQAITKIPLAPPEIAGSLNLRGHVVTAIDLYARLKFPLSSKENFDVNIVVESKGELYSLMIDKVVDVLQFPLDQIESNPSTLDENWQTISMGIVQQEKALIVIMDIDALLDFKMLS